MPARSAGFLDVETTAGGEFKVFKNSSQPAVDGAAMLAELVRIDLETLSPVDRVPDLPSNAVVHFVVGAVISVLTWWMNERSKVSPAEVDEIFRRLPFNVAD